MGIEDLSIKELEEELKWLEETPFYIGRDGMPSIALILFTILTGLIIGIIIIKVWRRYRIKVLKEEIKSRC